MLTPPHDVRAALSAHGPGRVGQSRVYVVQGDITRLTADILVYSTDSWGSPGLLYESYTAHVAGFAQAWRASQETEGREPLPIGATRFLSLVPEASEGPTQATSKPAAVVVTVITDGNPDRTGDPSNLSHPHIYQATKAALQTAIDEGRKRQPEERLLVAFPALGIGSGGAANEKLQAASCQMKAVHEVLRGYKDSKTTPAVDVVLVAYTPSVYQVLLEARRREFAGTQASPDFGETADGIIGNVGSDPAPNSAVSVLAPCKVAVPRDLLDSLQDGHCVLFVGAGLSRPTGLPDWQTLIAALVEKLNIPDENLPDAANRDQDYFLDLAQHYRHERPGGGQELETVIKELFTQAGARPTLAHYLLASLPVQFIITTNYDDLLEQALEGLRRYPLTVTTGEDVARTAGRGTHVVKFHGDINQDPPRFVLSRDDYDEFFTRHSALAALLEGLLLNRTFFFLGYSLRDQNFRQIVNRIASILREAKRPAYAATFDVKTAALTRAGWQSKKIDLIEIDGKHIPQPQQLLELLDWLAETVTGSQRLFLQPDADRVAAAAVDASESASLKRLRSTLEGAAREALRAVDGELNSVQAQQVAAVLEFLTACGWRPHQMADFDQDAAHRAWLSLAERVGNEQVSRRILVTALAEAQSADQVAVIRLRLSALGPKSSSQQE